MNRIIFDCVSGWNPVSGLYAYCHNLGDALLQLSDPAKEKFTFYVHPNSPAMFGPDQRYIIKKETHRIFQGAMQPCDIWHSTIQDAKYKPRNRRIKLLLTIHDLNFLIQRKGEPLKIRKYLRRIQRNIDRADHIVCISEYTRQDVLTHLKTHGKPVDLIYNGYKVLEFPGFDAPAYRPSKPFILALGAVVPKKNFHVLPCLLQHNDYELVISGTRHKDYEEKIMQQAALFGVSDRITFTGEIKEEDKTWYYKHCSAFMFPSLAEGFGAPMLEAMHFGKPTFIATNTCLPEVSGNRAYGFDHFDPEYMQHVFEESMAHYVSTNAKEAIRERALQFNWDRTAMDYLSIYRKL